MISESIDHQLARELGVKPKMVRFYALRMIVELAEGKPMSPERQRELFNQASKTKTEALFE